MQMINMISITHGQPAMAMPLIFIVALSMTKDIYEDYQRKKMDNEENNKRVLLLGEDGLFTPNRWRDLHVGRIIKVREDENLPADIVILNASNVKGLCYVETKNLDGETNLKTKTCEKALYNKFS
jgi:phospholipid-transporting ATPase